jgi:hypothetical protein
MAFFSDFPRFRRPMDGAGAAKALKRIRPKGRTR